MSEDLNAEVTLPKSQRFYRCILFTNGLVMVFGGDGQQLIGYQGQYGDVIGRIMEDLDPRQMELAQWDERAMEIEGVPWWHLAAFTPKLVERRT